MSVYIIPRLRRTCLNKDLCYIIFRLYYNLHFVCLTWGSWGCTSLSDCARNFCVMNFNIFLWGGKTAESTCIISVDEPCSASFSRGRIRNGMEGGPSEKKLTKPSNMKLETIKTKISLAYTTKSTISSFPHASRVFFSYKFFSLIALLFSSLGTIVSWLIFTIFSSLSTERCSPSPPYSSCDRPQPRTHFVCADKIVRNGFSGKTNHETNSLHTRPSYYSYYT